MEALTPVIELTITSGNDAGTRKQLTASHPIVIGRHAQCDWVLTGDCIAEFHCKLEIQQGRLLISPMSGTIILNGTPVLIKDSTIFKLGDVLSLGSMEVQIAVELARNIASEPSPVSDASVFSFKEWLIPVNRVLSGLGAVVCSFSIPKSARIPSMMVLCTGVAMCAVVLTAPATMNAHIIDQSHQATLMGLANQMAKAHELSGVLEASQEGSLQGKADTTKPVERVKLTVRSQDASSMIVPGVESSEPVQLTEKRPPSLTNSPVVFAGYNVDKTPFLLASDGSLYVENATLPGGGKLLSINGVSYSIETGDGIRIISTKHLEKLPKDQIDDTRLTQAILKAQPEGDMLAVRLRSSPFDKIITKAANTYSLDPSLIKAVVQIESNFNPLAVSNAGALGLMQLMPSTAERFKLDDPFHAEGNIMAGSQYLKILLDKFDNDVEMALAAYNAGEGTVKRYKGVPPYKETQNYIKKVTGLLVSYQETNI